MGLSLIPFAISKLGLLRLFQLISTANLVRTLGDNRQTFTVFAPTDEVLERFLATQPADIGNDAVRALLLNHVVLGEVRSTDLSPGQTVSTVGGAQLQVGQSGGGLTVGGAAISGPVDVEAGNGIVHVISDVITASGGGGGVPLLTNSLGGRSSSLGSGGGRTSSSSSNTRTSSRTGGRTSSTRTGSRTSSGSRTTSSNARTSSGSSSRNLPQVISGLGLSQLVDLVTAANLVSTLSDQSQQFTVFAPTNQAIRNFLASQPREVVDSITSGGPALTNLLLNHVVSGKILSSNVSPGARVTAVGGAELEVTSSRNGLMIGGARLSNQLDQRASNGVVHVIDDVIFPAATSMARSSMSLPEVISGLGLNQLVQLVTTANLVSTLADQSQTFTVFAPTDAAIQRFLATQPQEVVRFITSGGEALTNLLLNHVVPGRVLSSDARPGVRVQTVGGAELEVTQSRNGLMIGGARLSSMLDKDAANGVVHVIDDVIFPTSSSPSSGSSMSRSGMMSLPGVITGLGLNQLVQLVTTADLVSTLADEGQTFTVFAPTDAAIERFLASQPASVVRSISSGGQALTTLLLNHVVPGRILSSDVRPGATVQAVGGAELEVSRSRNGLMIGGARLSSMLDKEATNGVVHVIDDVIFPSLSPSVSQMTRSNQNLPQVITGLGLNQLVQLVSSAGLVETLADQSQTYTVFAPTDAAIQRFLASQPQDVVSSITSGGEALTNLLLNHVVPGRIMSSDARPGVRVTAVGGDELEVRSTMRGLTIAEARLSSKLDVPASNGVVHVIDDVIYNERNIPYSSGSGSKRRAG